MSPHDEILKAARDFGWEASSYDSWYVTLKRKDRTLYVQFDPDGGIKYAALIADGDNQPVQMKRDVAIVVAALRRYGS